ncbi:MAG: UDP-N-acetylmuramate--L-alanine ligase [Syntrophaceticus sp.]|nr:UDP-N-acetylmuramate--L-alanine ligase [Syntrophaceticus sp.]MDD3314188.1 UDP-N-acetylmuramate--L-alanine ligase [Syntrophaceticus sp.]MDD4359368.1 UDP-N-acetylmuramate--L-alanine ligase [Syntrophaceticus sp.]MDD4782456.1 UDP-N-acetylmuramate--L-alanine ligase [Syntrophaceticus sp.]HBG22752.1 UDP-N-acetylmuramate--L-alanine ligase [Peptococcaceae bacterium]
MTGKWYHFIGIGGVGMSGLAHVLLDMGLHVSGSDLVLSPVIDGLRQRGAEIFIGHRADNIYDDIDAVVISSAIRPSNIELCTARHKGLPVMARGDLLAKVMDNYQGIAVTGAHGKTTTSAMIAVVLAKIGLEPTFLVGGHIPQLGGNAGLGKGRYLVAESDESDGSFLKQRPYIAVITNIDDDHLDYYRDFSTIMQAFQEFLTKIRPDGIAVLCSDNINVRQLSTNGINAVTYGLQEGAQYQARKIVQNGLMTEAEIVYQGSYLGKLKLSVPGIYNVQNALAAVAVGRHLGLEFSGIARALAYYQNVHRRFQLIAQYDGIRIVDDYAHHPTEIKALMNAAIGIKQKRVITVFQPHRYSRTKLLQEEFGKAFEGSDVVIVTDIYAAGETPLEGVSGEKVVQELLKNGINALYINSLDNVVNLLLQRLCSGDTVLTVGAGDVWTVGRDLASKIEHCSQAN